MLPEVSRDLLGSLSAACRTRTPSSQQASSLQDADRQMLLCLNLVAQKTRISLLIKQLVRTQTPPTTPVAVRVQFEKSPQKVV
jgi:hypothetical protein